MRTRKEAHRDSREHHEKMAEHPPDNKALTWFRRPAGVVAMIQAQAAQMEKGGAKQMRLINPDDIKIPTDMIHNIGGCYMIRIEDVQRVILSTPTACVIGIDEAGECHKTERKLPELRN